MVPSRTCAHLKVTVCRTRVQISKSKFILELKDRHAPCTALPSVPNFPAIFLKNRRLKAKGKIGENVEKWVSENCTLAILHCKDGDTLLE